MGRGHKKKGGGGGHKVKTHLKGYATKVVQEPKTKPEDDKELVTKSTNWNGHRGLRNLGNTCYFNSILQNLIQTIPLRTHLVPRDPFSPTEVANRPKAGESGISAALRSTFVQMWLGMNGTYDPSPLFGALEAKHPRFRRKLQQDSHELLRLLMDEVDTEILTFLKKYKREFLGKPMVAPTPAPTEVKGENGEATSPTAPDASPVEPQTTSSQNAPQKLFTLNFFVNKQAGNLVPNESWNISEFEIRDKSGLVTYMEAIFGGRIESTLMCHSCGSVSSAYETFMDLSLPIPVRFLDEKLKRMLGYIPSLPKAPANHKKSSRAQSHNKPTNSAVEEEEDETTEEKVEYKTDYDCETLSSIGSSSSNHRIGQLNSQSDSSNNSRKSKTNPNVAARLKQQAKLDAAKATVKAPPPKPVVKRALSKKDQRKAKRLAQAAQATIESDEGENDVSELTDAQMMELALREEDEGDADLAKALADSSAPPSTSASSETELPPKHEKTSVASNTDDGAPAANIVSDGSDSGPSNVASDATQAISNGDSPSTDAASTVLAESTERALESIVQPSNATELLASGVPATPPINAQADASENASTLSVAPSSSEPAVETTESPSESATSATEEGTLDQQAVEIVLEHKEVKGSADPTSSYDANNEAFAPIAAATGTGAAEASEPKEAEKATALLTASQSTARASLNPQLKHDIRSIARPGGLSVEACLYEFTEPEILSGANAYGCYECTKRAFLKEGRDIYHLVMQYGSKQEKEEIKQSGSVSASYTPSSSLASSAPSATSSSATTDTEESSSAEPSNDVQSLESANGLMEKAAEEESANGLTEKAASSSPEEESGPSVGSPTTTIATPPHTREESRVEALEEEEPRTQEAAEEQKAAQPESSGNETNESDKADGTQSDSDDDSSDEEEPVVVLEKTEDEKAVELEKAAAKKTPTVSENSIPLVKSIATKQILIDEVPQILTIHLKRFWQTLSGSAKIDLKVEFPVVLDISPYLSRSAKQRYTASEADPVRGKPKRALNLESVKYQLYGIVVHSGSMSGGHYVAYTRKRDNPISDTASLDEIRNGWHYFSDTQTSPSSLENVLNQQAYILFYERLTD
jgi:ubiquitin C-terminal hydrolase